MDIETRAKLKVGAEQARIVQNYQTLVEVVSAALGGKESSPSSVPAGAAMPKNSRELTQAFNSVFG